MLGIFLDDDHHVPRLRRHEGPDVGGLDVSLQGRGGSLTDDQKELISDLKSELAKIDSLPPSLDDWD